MEELIKQFLFTSFGKGYGGGYSYGFSHACDSGAYASSGQGDGDGTGWGDGGGAGWGYTNGIGYGTGEELIKKAYQDSEKSGREYERVVRYVESILADEELED